MKSMFDVYAYTNYLSCWWSVFYVQEMQKHPRRHGFLSSCDVDGCFDFVALGNIFSDRNVP